MKYMLLIYGNETTWNAMSEGGYGNVIRAHTELIADLTESGELIGYDGLTTVNAKTVRRDNGRAVVTDGPFTEAKEVLAGYYLVDCDSAERAAEIASRCPEAAYSPIEVRRLMDKGGMEM